MRKNRRAFLTDVAASVVMFGVGMAMASDVVFYEAGKTVAASHERLMPSALETSGRRPKARNTLVVTGRWDVAACGAFEATFAEPAQELVRCMVMLENSDAVPPDPRCYHSEGTFKANLGLQSTSNVTALPIPPAMPEFQAAVARMHRMPFTQMFAEVWPHPYWSWEAGERGYGFSCWTLDVSRPVVRLTFTWAGDGKLVRLAAGGPKNTVREWPAFAKVKADDFLPFMDKYGQFKWKEWPGKTHSDADLKRALAEEDADLAAHPGPASFDRWGGWKDGPKQKATGAFYITKINGMWWFVDPDGNLWWSNGPLRVSASTAMTPYKGREDHFEWLPPEEGDPFSLFYKTRDELMWPYWLKRGITNSFDFSAANLYRKYGEDWHGKWAERAHRRLRSWGANTIGNSSDRKVVEMSRTPYVERFEIKSLPIRGGDQNVGWWPLRDPYDASFAANVRQQLKERQYQLNDPWCVGFFVDNELPWGFEGHVGRLVWDSPEDQPVKQVFRRWLAERHGKAPETPSDEDFRTFSHVVPEEYFRQIRLAFDEVAPKKLYLGCRGMALEYIAKAAEKYVDAASQNWYDRDVSRFFYTPPDNPNMGCAGLATVDKPIIIGEFHMGARDRGPLWGSLVTLKDQNERAAVYRRFLTSALEHPRFIGTHWHHFSDEPTSGRFDGEAMQNGWTDVCDTPYPETIEAVRWVGENMYRIRWAAGLRNRSVSLLAVSAFAENPGLVDFGVAYYPEAWPESRWETDLGMMKDLGMSLIRIGEFNWGNFEPKEGEFDFKPYLRLLDLCERHGIKVMMCTPTAATPTWMQRDYPNTLKTRKDGTQPGPGGRQQACASSERFRFFSRRVVEKMAEAFKDHPAVTTWQLDNELSVFGGTGLCECERCRQGFIKCLQARFGTLEELNRSFNGAFWSGTFSKWEDVRLPLHDTRCDWRTEYLRYQGQQFLSYLLNQADVLRKANPRWRLTSNNPSASNMARHDILFRTLGYAAADTYICWNDKVKEQAKFLDVQSWTWSMFCGLTGAQKPFMIGESGPFCFDADIPYSYDLVKPFFYLTLGFDAESFLYFRWRESVSGEETHPAVLPWSGRKTFVYAMLKKQMDEYAALPESIARLPLDKGEVAIVHDAESHIYSLTHAYGCSWKGTSDKLFDVEVNLHSALRRRGVKVDIVQLSEGMSLSPYKVAFFPQHYTVSESTMRQIRDYAAEGGAVVAINRFNFAEPRGWNFRTDVGPAGMTDFFGIEIDERRSISYGNVELAVPTTAETIRALDGTCFKGKSYLTRNAAGKGSAWYVTQVPTRDMCRDLVTDILPRAGVVLREELPDCVYRLTRGGYVIVVNFTKESQTIVAESGRLFMGEPEIKEGRMTLKPLTVAIWRE